MRNPCEGLMNRVGVQSKWARRTFYIVIARASPSNPDDMLLLLQQQCDDINDNSSNNNNNNNNNTRCIGRKKCTGVPISDGARAP